MKRTAKHDTHKPTFYLLTNISKIQTCAQVFSLRYRLKPTESQMEGKKPWEQARQKSAFLPLLYGFYYIENYI